MPPLVSWFDFCHEFLSDSESRLSPITYADRMLYLGLTQLGSPRLSLCFIS